MNALAMADDLDRELNEPGKVLDFTKPSPEAEVERLADLHRRGEAKYRQRAADTRRAMKLRDQGFKADERTEIARHKAAMELIAEQRANNKELGERDIAADERLANYNRAAVDMLMAE